VCTCASTLRWSGQVGHTLRWQLAWEGAALGGRHRRRTCTDRRRHRRHLRATVAHHLRHTVSGAAAAAAATVSVQGVERWMIVA
jgi:hypothetical protein